MSAKPARDSASAILRNRKQDFVREAIWTAAIDLFSEQGFEETTVDEIAAAAGTSRRTFFRYFESKRDLLAQPVSNYAASIAAAIESCPHKLAAAAILRRVVLEVANRTLSDPRMRKVMTIAARNAAAREAQRSRLAEVQDQIADAFAARSKDPLTAHCLAALTLSALSLIYREWFSQSRKDIDSAAARVFKELGETLSL